MIETPPYAKDLGDGQWQMLVRVQPGAKRSEFAGVLDGRLRIRLVAPAVENKANMALLEFVAKALGIRASRVRLASGETGRLKRLLVHTETEPDWAGLTF